MNPHRRNAIARLFYLIGASGSGKDTLIDYCRSRLRPDDGVKIARRYITRPANAGGETHAALTEAEFEQRRAAGDFALHWTANGLRYGIGMEMDDWLHAGARVLVNGSRAHVAAALTRYGTLLVPVEVRVAPDTLRARLVERGREGLGQIDARLRRSQRLEATGGSQSTLIVDNSGSVAAAGERLLRILTVRHRTPV